MRKKQALLAVPFALFAAWLAAALLNSQGDATPVRQRRR